MKRATNPVWRETLVLDLDGVVPASTTLLFTIQHVTKLKSVVLGSAILHVTAADGTVVGNTTHVLPLLRPFKKKSDAKTAQKDSAALPPLIGSSSTMTLSIATRLDSTELSQNASMYSLLQWKKVWFFFYYFL